MEILDCTIRDGGYLNNWKFEDNLVREVYRSVSKSGVDIIELGFMSSNKTYKDEKYGPWRYLEESKLNDIMTGIQGIMTSVLVNYKEYNITSLVNKEESLIDLIRVAVHKNVVKEALELMEVIKSKGYKSSIQLMGYSTYTKEEQNSLIDLLEKYEVDYAYVADSYGSILPFQISELCEPLLELKKLKVGFHPHNNLQMGLANAMAAMNCGVHIIDGTIYGMGRGAGNLPIESLVSYLQVQGSEKYNVIPILHLVDKYFVKLHQKFKWGHQLPYMLSGIFSCHPDYPKKLVELHEYTIEDIWKALEAINNSKQIGFNGELLDKLINFGLIGKEEFSLENGAELEVAQVDCTPQYINRHKDSDFLILANGPNLKKNKEHIDAFIEKYDPVIMGANFISDLFCPHYHAFNNKRRFENYISKVNEKSKLLVSNHFSEELIRKQTDREYEKLCFSNTLTDFDIKDGIIQSSCKTISVLLMGVAIVMGANRIFGVGMDGYVNKDSLHFYDETDEPEDMNIFIQRHKWMQHYLEQINDYLIKQNKEGIHILTPTGFGNFYNSIKNYI